jgi:predicted lactoylglutathione lyase
MTTKVFINLPVKDLAASMDFFGRVGFVFNEDFTNENAACLIVSDTVYVMLLTEEFFQTFTKKEIVDATKMTEVLTALSVESKEAVDDLLEKALEAGAQEGREGEDQELMYSRSFEDPDGHMWEIFCMDESKVVEGTP